LTIAGIVFPLLFLRLTGLPITSQIQLASALLDLTPMQT
jgi:hypothetical protein